MSDLTRLVRYLGFGSVLDAVNAAEATVKTAVANPSPETLAGAAAAVSGAAAKVAAAIPSTPQQTQAAATVAVHNVGVLLSASATALIASRLGPAATFAEPVVQSLIGEFEAWLESKL